MNSLPQSSLAVRRQRTAVYLCDPARERKADSESFARTRGATPYEHVEDVIDAFGVDPRPLSRTATNAQPSSAHARTVMCPPAEV